MAKRVQQRSVEHVVDVPVPPVVDEIEEVPQELFEVRSPWSRQRRTSSRYNSECRDKFPQLVEVSQVQHICTLVDVPVVVQSLGSTTQIVHGTAAQGQHIETVQVESVVTERWIVRVARVEKESETAKEEPQNS